MEADEENGPDREAIRSYLKTLGVTRMGQISDDEELSQDGDVESSSDDDAVKNGKMRLVRLNFGYGLFINTSL